MAEENLMPDPMSTPIMSTPIMSTPVMSTPIMSTPIGGAGPFPAGSNAAPFLPYDDLRQWIEEARKLGVIKEVKNLSSQREIRMVAEIAPHAHDSARFLFSDLPPTITGT